MYYINTFNTKFGTMLAIADHEKLYSLKFINDSNLENNINNFLKKYKLDIKNIIFSKNNIITQTIEQINLYSNYKLTTFTIPLNFPNPFFTEFQNTVLNQIYKIPYKTKISYLELAENINKPTAFRAVANACGINDIVIIIPCHRIIASNNKLGGYSNDIINKINLLNHEQKNPV